MFGTMTWQKVTIADAASKSNALYMGGRKLVAIMQPANCEGTAFGAEAAFDYNPTSGAGTFTKIYNVIQESTGAAPVTTQWEIAKSATVSQFINLPPAFQIEGPMYIKIISEDGSNAASAQTGEAVIWLGFRELE